VVTRTSYMAGATGVHAFLAGGDQRFAGMGGADESDLRVLGDGGFAAGVDRERHRGVGDCEDKAAVADFVAVGHCFGDGHR
jgi:hypothetical protein